MVVLLMTACLGLSFDLVGCSIAERSATCAGCPCRCPNCGCRAPVPQSAAAAAPGKPSGQDITREADETQVDSTSTPCGTKNAACPPGDRCSTPAAPPAVAVPSTPAMAVPVLDFVSPPTYRRGFFGRRCRSGNCR